VSLTEYGRSATRLITNTGARYSHPYEIVSESVVENTAPLDEYGQFVLIPHVDVRFFSFNGGESYGDFTYEDVHGELLKVLVSGGPTIYTVYMDNADQPGGGDGSWDLFRPASGAAEEHIIEPGLFINPVDGDISAGNLMLKVY
jgi:hypothetical protein